MKTILRIAIVVTGFQFSAFAQSSAPVGAVVTPSAVLNSDPDSFQAGPQGSTDPDIQMVTCTDKLTYVDRHPQGSTTIKIGGYFTSGWSLYQAYPNFTGTVTEAYATLKQCGPATNLAALYIYALNSSYVPTGPPLDSVFVNVNTSSFTEFGGVLNTPATITQYGFAVCVHPRGGQMSDSVNVADHTDPDNRGLSYYYYTTLENALTVYSLNEDFLLRAKISYTAPTQNATASPSSVCLGSPINFSLTQTATPIFYSSVWASPTSPGYSWNFGDAGTATTAAPSHTYAATGTYTVSATKTNMGWTLTCPSAAATTTVSITQMTPSVHITASANPVCPNGTSIFTASPTNGGSSPSYVWKKNGIQVGTGSTYSGSTWNAGDVMTCEMISNASCTSTAPVVSNAITMFLQPLVFSSYNYSATGLSVSFTSTAVNAVTWSWNFGDAGTSVSSNPVHNYASAGIYTVDLTVTNSCGQSTSSSINITVDSTSNSTGGNTGLVENELHVDLNAFPNPVNDDLSINYKINHTTDVTIEVLNTLGQVVATQGIDNTSEGTAHVSMENMSSGLYFVRFRSGENNVQTIRIVRQ